MKYKTERKIINESAVRKFIKRLNDLDENKKAGIHHGFSADFFPALEDKIKVILMQIYKRGRGRSNLGYIEVNPPTLLQKMGGSSR